MNYVIGLLDRVAPDPDDADELLLLIQKAYCQGHVDGSRRDGESSRDGYLTFISKVRAGGMWPYGGPE